MVFEYILKNNGIDPAADLEIDQSIDFGSTAAAFTGDASAAFTVEFEPSATALEKEGAGYVVASLGVDSGYVPYTSYSAKTSFLNENPQVIQSFTTALQKGMDYVQSHTPEEIAQVIAPQFPETDLDTLTIIVTRYYEQDTWKDNLVFEQDSFVPSEALQQSLAQTGVTIGTVFDAKAGDGSLLGYVMESTSANGYGGDIVLYVGIRLDGTVNGVKILEMSETPGLGQEAPNVLTPQFAGKKVDSFTYTKTGAKADNEVDAITSATVTTKAVTEAVNGALAAAEELPGGGAQNE